MHGPAFCMPTVLSHTSTFNFEESVSAGTRIQSMQHGCNKNKEVVFISLRISSNIISFSQASADMILRECARLVAAH